MCYDHPHVTPDWSAPSTQDLRRRFRGSGPYPIRPGRALSNHSAQPLISASVLRRVAPRRVPRGLPGTLLINPPPSPSRHSPDPKARYELTISERGATHLSTSPPVGGAGVLSFTDISPRTMTRPPVQPPQYEHSKSTVPPHRINTYIYTPAQEHI